ncbi:MAG: hypothetical protein ACRC6M_11890 [Microcystaceae cyanobacterium]
MSFSDFTLASVKQKFGLNLHEIPHFFQSIESVIISENLQKTLEENTILALASNTEKARSEMLIIPILIELRRLLNNQISFFSGISFNVDPNQGLNGNCDYIISRSPELLFLNAPVVTLVEAKKEDLNLGIGQCLAEMIAAQIFNQQNNQEINTIYGVISSGTNWRFLKLIGHDAHIDLNEYYLQDIAKILGILIHFSSQPEL